MNNALKPASIHEFKRAAELKLRGVRCPDHRRTPRVRVTGASLRDAQLYLSGCCDKVMALANRAIGLASAP